MRIPLIPRLGEPRFRRLLKVLLVASCLFTLTGFAGYWYWLLDLTSHFRLQYALILLLGTGLLLWRRRWRWAMVLLPFLVVNLLQIAPYYIAEHPRQTQAIAEEDPLVTRMQVLHINLWNKNTQYQWVADYIRRVNPDVISMAEYEHHLHEGLHRVGAFSTYPYQYFNYEVALYSRYPIAETRVIGAKWLRDQTLVVRLLVDDRPVTVILAHTKTPVSSKFYRRQLAQFQRIAEALPQLADTPVLVLGDLNTTPWSYPLSRFLRQTGLRDSQQGFGLQPSWPTLFILPWLPIDHCLVSEDIIVLSRKTGPFIGSDHLPVLLELGLPAPAHTPHNPEATMP